MYCLQRFFGRSSSVLQHIKKFHPVRLRQPHERRVIARKGECFLLPVAEDFQYADDRCSDIFETVDEILLLLSREKLRVELDAVEHSGLDERF